MKKLLLTCLFLLAALFPSALADTGALDLPDDLVTIESEAFCGLQDVTTVILPDTVTTIGSRAFANSSLTDITLPRSLTSIANDAFQGCKNLHASVYADSYALAYCQNASIPYTIVEEGESATAYIMYASKIWDYQFWLDGNAYPGVTASTAKVTGPGTYTVSLTLDGTASGTAFCALGIANGETLFPGHIIAITDVSVNGRSIPLGKEYTTSDDGVETRVNIYNEWVSVVPPTGRREDGNLEGASAIIASAADLSGITTLSVTFRYIYGEPPAIEDDTLTEEEIAAIRAANYNAYVAVQSESYIFRCYWYESFAGKDTEDGKYFYQLTGFDENGDYISHGGSFTDCRITGNSTYSVGMLTGPTGFGSDTFFRRLAVSTDIPAVALEQNILTLSDIYVTVGDGDPQECIWLNIDGYVNIIAVDEYNIIGDIISYTMPGCNDTVTFSFTIGGLTE